MSVIFILILFLCVGFFFIGCGIYFGKDSFLNQLAGYTDDKNSVNAKQRKYLGNVTSLFSLGVGGLTIASGIVIFVLPQIKEVILLVYLSLLFIGLAVLGFTIGHA